MSAPANLSEQILALPNGAGSIQSAGETFEVRAYTGTGSYTVPIPTHPGHAGISPSLALRYSTHGGNDIAGLGWSLGLASVQRRTDRGLPEFDNAVDTFALQDDELLPVGGGYYRPRIETRFARIRHVVEIGSDFWVVSERDGSRAFFGLDPDYRLHDDAGHIAAWYLSKKQDANGNELVFSHRRDASTRDVRLSTIEWAGCYRVRFHYEPRPDPIVSFLSGFEHRQRFRLARIDLDVQRTSNRDYHTYRTYSLEYRTSTTTGRSLLTGVAATGINPDGEEHVMPPLTFGYNEPDLTQKRWHQLSGSLPGRSLDDGNLTLVRQSGSGLPDILETTGIGHFLRRNLGDGRFGSPQRVASPAQVLLENAGTFISDMSGNGWGDLVVNGGRQVYRGAAGGGWGTPYVSAHVPSVDLDAPDVRVADLNADGIPDALRAGVGCWVYFENLGDGAWAPGQNIPNPPPARLDDPRVHLADVNGDGLDDLVFVEQSRIMVWPGEGSGKFGSPYQLEHSPNFGPSFDPKCVRLVDLTRSGQADLLYAKGGTALLCLNLAGVSFSDPIVVATVPQSSHGHVEPVDLLGSGAEGLLFTDHQAQTVTWRFLEPFTGGRPDLLSRIEGGLGATTTITYTSSARDWIADNQAGRPWKTAMPSPELVVASVTNFDSVTGNRLGVSYRYHHGVYDGTEREFRGFGMVEQIDREADAGDPQPLAPVLFKRWFHTGFDLNLSNEYAALPEGSLNDDVPKLPWALRSLRGLLKREETYALDGNSKPYVVQETAYQVFPMQREPHTGRYSFAPLAIKARTTHLERSDERRVVETTTIYDRHSGKGYGLPVEVREKAYGRRGAFSTSHELAQAEDLERFTITEYVNRDELERNYFAPYTPSYLVGKPALIERYGVAGSLNSLLARERFFYDGEDYQGLGYPGTSTPPGVVRGRLSSKLVLAFTDDLLESTFPVDSGARTRFDFHGQYLPDGDGHYLHAQRFRYNERGLVIGLRDPNGNETTLEYDSSHALFPTRRVDAAGHPTNLIRGELPFQIESVLDPNGNTTSLTYDPSGLMRSKSLQGKHDGTDWTGDPPSHPTEAYSCELETIPARVRTRTRQQRLGATLDTVRYTDGFGRTIQERHTAETDPENGAKRYRVTGWQIFNHKGLVVKSYQPVFAETDEYSPGNTTTAVVETRYDPLGRAIRIDHPDDTFETTEYHPWVRTIADRNDNAGHIQNTDPRYGRFAAGLKDHVHTPARTFVDALGRVMAIAEDNGGDLHVTLKRLDLKDQVIEVRDPRELAQATYTFVYDYAERVLCTRHVTALGERYALADAAGNPIWARDARAIEIIRTFDEINRPLDESTSEGGTVKLRRQSRYIGYDEQAPEFATYQDKNVFGPAEEERDSDGLRFFEYDWRGLRTKTTHRFWTQEDSSGRAWDDSNSELWTGGASWDPAIPGGDRESLSFLHLPDLSEADRLTVENVYDAAGRPVEIRYPEGMTTFNSYTPSGLLGSVEVDRGTGGRETVVDAFGYNARRQLTYFRHSNGVETSQEYDQDLERLTRIFTRIEEATHFQDLAYMYDPAGNPVEIADNLASSSFSHNQIIPNTRTFRYDPRYRLIQATGKKHRSVRRKDSDVLVTSPDPNDYEPYTIRYEYDAAGNFIRNQEYSAGTLRYKTDRVDLFNGDRVEAGSFDDSNAGNFRYDANGNTTHTPRHEELAYTHDNQIRYANLNGGGQVRYFRHGDQRVLRLVKKNGVTALAVYLGPFEYRFRKATTGHTKLVLHVYGHGRHAQAEHILAGSDPDSLELFFHHADHLGSGHVLTTLDGELLNQEENFAYGSVSDRRDARNRYRYIGVEQDEDTHLYMTGPRTYDPVSGRFLQGDPIAETRFDVSPYVYASASPLRRLDPGGYADEPKPTPEQIKNLSTVDISGWDEVPSGLPPGGGFGNGLPVDGYEDATTDKFSAPEGRDLSESSARTTDLPPGDAPIPREPTPKGNPADFQAKAMDDFMSNDFTELKIARDIPKPTGAVHLELADEAVDVASDAAQSGAKSAASLGLDMAKKSIKKGIPLLGLYFASETVAEAKQAGAERDYVTAGFKIASLGYDPIDWGYAAAGVRIYVTESIREYRAAQTSANIYSELMKIQAEQNGEVPLPVYEGPCPSCHY